MVGLFLYITIKSLDFLFSHFSIMVEILIFLIFFSPPLVVVDCGQVFVSLLDFFFNFWKEKLVILLI